MIFEQLVALVMENMCMKFQGSNLNIEEVMANSVIFKVYKGA